MDLGVLYLQDEDPSHAKRPALHLARLIRHKTQQENALSAHLQVLRLHVHFPVVLPAKPDQFCQQVEGQILSALEGQLHLFAAAILNDSQLDQPDALLAHQLPAALDFWHSGDLVKRDGDGILGALEDEFEPAADRIVDHHGRLHANYEVIDSLLHRLKLVLVEVFEGVLLAHSKNVLREFREALIVKEDADGDDAGLFLGGQHDDAQLALMHCPADAISEVDCGQGGGHDL